MLVSLSQALASIIQQIALTSIRRDVISQPFFWCKDSEPLLWLDAAPLYPKCYWQSRDAKQEVLALGQVAEFTHAAQAEQSIKAEQRVWGKRSFASVQAPNGEDYFFLPMIELVRNGENWSVQVNLGADNNKTKQSLIQLAQQGARHAAFAHCSDNPIIDLTHTPSSHQWSALVDNALHDIAHTALEKVVLARQTQVTLAAPVSAAALLQASREANPENFHFLFARDDKQQFIGSTPERLFRRDGEILHTEALAGTAPRALAHKDDNRLAQWLLADKKNRHENQLVVTDIAQSLADLCQLDVAPMPHIVRLRNVQHLKRAITGNLIAATTSAHLLSALQPTAAVAGYPKQSAITHLLHNEPFVRGAYSGALGFISQASSEFCVAIRSAVVTGNQVDLYAGAGIVPGSDAAQEWQELERKVATLLGLIGHRAALQKRRA